MTGLFPLEIQDFTHIPTLINQEKTLDIAAIMVHAGYGLKTFTF
jgi:hypothetical protein